MADFDAFYAALSWRPIAEYDFRRPDALVLLRSGSEWALGYWGVAEGEPAETWRHAQESMDEVPLDFDPEEYAEVDDEWREHLMAD